MEDISHQFSHCQISLQSLQVKYEGNDRILRALSVFTCRGQSSLKLSGKRDTDVD